MIAAFADVFRYIKIWSSSEASETSNVFETGLEPDSHAHWSGTIYLPESGAVRTGLAIADNARPRHC